MGRLAWLRELDERVLGPGGPPPAGRHAELALSWRWRISVAVAAVLAYALYRFVGGVAGLAIVVALVIVESVMLARHERRVRRRWRSTHGE